MACKVKVNQHGFLAFRLYWKGHKLWEGTRLKDTAKNRERMQARAVLISEEMEQGWFDYLKWFPDGNKAAQFKPKPDEPLENNAITIREFFAAWIERKKPPFVRRSLERDYRQAFDKNILPFMGDLDLNRVTSDTLDKFRIYLVNDRGLAVKTARNIIDGALRPMFRDAGRRIERNPFNDLPTNWWPRLPQKEPDPFTEQERDAILRYYRANRPYWAYAFVYFRFWTGTRPSEATALKWGSVDLLNAKATFTLSRHLGEENAPKTRASRRTVTLLPNVVDILKAVLPLRVAPNSYVFTDGLGKPIDQAEFGRAFQGVLRVLGIRQRPFYNQRHTFISVALTLGCNQKWIAEQTGTSIAMIQQNYGRYIRDDGDKLLRDYVESANSDEQAEESETTGEMLSTKGAKYVEALVVPTGIEPVFPT